MALVGVRNRSDSIAVCWGIFPRRVRIIMLGEALTSYGNFVRADDGNHRSWWLCWIKWCG